MAGTTATTSNNTTLPLPSEELTATAISVSPAAEVPVPIHTSTSTSTTTLDALLASHKKQLRDLQALITQKKRSASKKTRRGVNDECERLERELKDRQRVEVEGLSHDNEEAGDAEGQAVTEQLSRVHLDDNEQNERDGEEEDDGDGKESESISISTSSTSTPTLNNTSTNNNHHNHNHNHNNNNSNNNNSNTNIKKPNRQKARLARRQQDLLDQAAQAAKEAQSQPDLRALEQSRMSALFQKHSVVETQIAPDGHCLYSAFAYGLNDIHKDDTTEDGEEEEGRGEREVGTELLTYKHTRSAAASYITSHPDDFSPFLLDENVTVGQHADTVKNTAEWGGEMELLALARRYDVVVRIIQAEGNGVVSLNDDDDDGNGNSNGLNKRENKEKEEIWLAYHRRGYGLGEHYNALTKKSKTDK